MPNAASTAATAAPPRARLRAAHAAAAALALLAALLGTPPATAAEGSRQEAETTCTGGSLLNDTGYSLGLARAAGNGNSGGPVTCSVVVPAGKLATFRWYGRSAPETARVDVALSGATTLAATTVTRPVSAAPTYHVLVWSAVLNAGTTTLTASRSGNAAVGMDYWTLDPDTVAPTAPAGLTASRAAGDVDLAWTASSDNLAVAGYRVRIGAGPWTSGLSSPWRHVGGGSSAQDYEVQAYDASGNVSSSGTVHYTPPPDRLAPSTPTSVAATASGADVTLTWAASTDDVAVAGYRVRVGTGAWTDGVGPPWTHAGGAGTSQTYEVRAYDAAGNESAGGSAAYVPPADTTAPTEPGALAVQELGGDLSVSWSPSTDAVGVTGYRIRADGGSWVHGVSSPWTHPGAASTSHTYDVQAYDAAGNLSAPASTGWTAPGDTSPPTPPGSPSTTEAGGDVLLTWSAASDDRGVTGYRVRVDGGEWTSPVGSPWTHPGGAGAPHTYDVQAYDAAGNSSAPVTVSHVPPPVAPAPDTTAPSAPGGVTASPSGTDVAVGWAAATDDTVVAGYRIRVDGGPWTTSAASPWLHAGGAGDAHTYEVQAYDAAGNLSPVASAAYAPPPVFSGTPAGTVTLTSPAPGSGVPAAVPTRITWSTTGLPGPAVRVELVRDTDVVSTLAAAAPVAAGQLAWTPARTLPAEGSYAVRLTSTTDDRISTTSALFAVTHPTLTVTSHATPTTWAPGVAQTVTWEYSGTPVGGVRLQVSRRGQVVAEVVASAPYGAGGKGSASFVPPASLGAGTDYRVRASWVAFPGSFDLSDGDSTSAGSAAVTLASPVAGAAWTAGTSHAVTWSTTGPVTGDVRLELLKGSEVAAVIAAAVPAAAGSHTWTSPARLASGSDYWVRITSRTSPVLFDRVPLRVDGTALTVAVADPGTTWVAGTPRTISWSPDGVPGTAVRLDLVSSTGRLVPITASTPLADGRLTWSPPLTVVRAGNYRVRALVVGNALVSGVSPTTMWTAHPTAEVVQPMTAQSWTTGAPATLSWQLSHAVAAPVTLTLVRDATSIPVATARPTGANGGGTFTWTPPLTLSPAEGYRLRVTAAHNPAVRTTGAAPVELRRPALSLTSPSSGATWSTGTTVSAAWQLDGGAVAPVRVELLRATLPVAVLGASSPTGPDGRGSVSWAVPATLPGGAYTLRVRPAATATSPAVEAALPVTVDGPTVSVATPAGWARGSTVTASWSTTRWAGTTAKVELVNGTRVTLLSSAAPMSGGVGSLTWPVPSTLAAGSTYRVRVTLPGSAVALSGVFAVS